MKKTLKASATALIILISLASGFAVYGQDTQLNRKLFIGGGALPDTMYYEFLQFIGPDAKLVVIPTATGREIVNEEIIADWATSGFKNVTVLHTRDREVSSNTEFSNVLKEADAIWFSGGSQDRIAAAYLDTPVEQEVYSLLQRGGIIGGSSAGAAIMSRTMIIGGNPVPDMAIGFDLLPGVILDQHFLRRNRLPRLMAAVRANPEMIGLGIDEATAIVVENGEAKVVGESYVIRIEQIDGKIKVDAYEAGEVVPLARN